MVVNDSNFLDALLLSVPPEISSGDRTVYSGPGGKADLKCTVKAEPRANVSKRKFLT